MLNNKQIRLILDTFYK